MDNLLNFIKTTLANNATIQEATQGRVYPFETKQGTHTYPLIFWQIISTKNAALELCGVGQVWQSEVQVDVFTCQAESSARLGGIVRDAFNWAIKTTGILAAYSDQVTPAYADEDATIHYAVRVFVNHF